MHPRSFFPLSLAALIFGSIGCGNKENSPITVTSTTFTNETVAVNGSGGAPGPTPTPTTPVTLSAPEGNYDAILGELTRELRRTMIGRRLSGSFDEFVAISNVKVPPPPAGKKYAISKQWKVILVDR